MRKYVFHTTEGRMCHRFNGWRRERERERVYDEMKLRDYSIGNEEVTKDTSDKLLLQCCSSIQAYFEHTLNQYYTREKGSIFD